MSALDKLKALSNYANLDPETLIGDVILSVSNNRAYVVKTEFENKRYNNEVTDFLGSENYNGEDYYIYDLGELDTSR